MAMGAYQALLAAGKDKQVKVFGFDGADDVLRFPTTEPRWRPAEADWAMIKQRSVEHVAEVAIVGVGADAENVSSASVRIRTSKDAVGDSIFYREVPLPFITGYDLFPLGTLEAKRRLLRRAFEEQWSLLFYHDPRVAVARIRKDKDRYVLGEARA